MTKRCVLARRSRVNDRPRSGRHRVTTAAQNRYIRVRHIQNRATTATTTATPMPGLRTISDHPLGYFSFQPMPHDWCTNGHGMCYPVFGKMHIKEPLLLIEKSSLCGGSWFPLSLSEWLFTIIIIMSDAYNRK